MNAVGRSTGPTESALIRSAYSEMQSFAEKMQKLETAVDGIAESGDDTAHAATRKLKRKIRDFEPSVTMIGQVKAGKTTLVNALTGRPGLLPADINPWTSVVTSLHLDPSARTDAGKAKFRFFDQEEWDRLLTRGGRMGELASRAGAHKELEKVRIQLEEMREKSRQRLGRKFELLIGQEHEYGYIDEELIQRYVCLGDDQDADNSTDQKQGQFADITKSADLYFGQPALPHRLCIRDTPGVNDTFMIREQITVNAIRESRLCVVVLSAHQALSTVDMALIRLISNIRSRDVIIFVNRIDELNDPVRETEEIRKSIVNTLETLDGPTDAKIVFGSALWAAHALNQTYEKLGKASSKALIDWAQHEMKSGTLPKEVHETIWHLSGVPALCKAISSRVETGEGAEFMERTARSAQNIANGIAASREVVSKRLGGETITPVAPADVGREFDAIAARNLDRLDAELGKLISGLDNRLAGARRSFLGRATASLLLHLENNGDNEIWNYDPAGLRLLLRSAYRIFTVKAVKTGEKIFEATADEIRTLYIRAYQLSDDAAALAPAVMPPPPPPVILGSTIALDVKGSWWTKWWRRRRQTYHKFAEEYAALIDAEIEPILASLRASHADVYSHSARDIFTEFLDAERSHLLHLANQTETEIETLRQRTEMNLPETENTLNDSLVFLSEINPRNEWRAAL
ncbi:dynamin family protein [Aliiroseovarius sp. KMU-50]|uniref:Dynamin family protein n=1 Tax=Aliiroseovarius salicola TaxID=3009082 RepID=A0ABT4VX56_9RHOB|nr:dynamin family protein [Aliiroseovarius sp. KMU-50]MDA5092851.1 dynamin family protein [Aliiroseovarius sp. KMU-50]